MITANLLGGLGNQMFQIATAYGLAKDLNDECGFDLSNCHTPLQGHTSSKYANSYFNKLNSINILIPEVYREPSFNYTEISGIEGDVTLSGYFQSEKYFSKYKTEIQELFNNFDIERNAAILTILMNIPYKTTTAIHVRRGDYINPPSKEEFHSNLSKTDYYQKAMKLIGNESAYIFVSDDIQWCKDNFKGDNIYYSPFTEELDDLYLMKMCDNHIIANSSFSWWGAYLCDSPKQTVIAPKEWFGPRGPKETEDLIPKEWIKI